MTIVSYIFWLLAAWGIATLAALVCWWAYVTIWIVRHARGYPSVRVAREACEQRMLYRILTAWLGAMVMPVIMVIVAWRCYNDHLNHQHTIEKMKRQGWDVTTHMRDDGTMEVLCEQHMPNVIEEQARDMMEQGVATVEEGIQR